MNITNPKRLISLVASLLVAFGPALLVHETWSDFLEPRGVGEALGVLGGVLLAWLSKSPRQHAPD